MTLDERVLDAQTRSMKLYLERQTVELTRQQAMVRAQQIDLELVKLDGELALLETLQAEAP